MSRILLGVLALLACFGAKHTLCHAKKSKTSSRSIFLMKDGSTWEPIRYKKVGDTFILVVGGSPYLEQIVHKKDIKTILTGQARASYLKKHTELLATQKKRRNGQSRREAENTFFQRESKGKNIPRRHFGHPEQTASRRKTILISAIGFGATWLPFLVGGIVEPHALFFAIPVLGPTALGLVAVALSFPDKPYVLLLLGALVGAIQGGTLYVLIQSGIEERKYQVWKRAARVSSWSRHPLPRPKKTMWRTSMLYQSF